MLNRTNPKTALVILCMVYALTACIQKTDEKQKNDEKQATVKKQTMLTEAQTQNQQNIPAMLAQSFKMKLAQPVICKNEHDFNDQMVCTHYEVIGLKSNIGWIDQSIDQHIRQDFAASLKVATAAQAKQNQTKVEGIQNWSKNVRYDFYGQFGRYVQVVQSAGEYSGGAHGMAYTTNYVYDLKNKKRMTLDDIVVTGQRHHLKQALWKEYLKYCDEQEMQPFIDEKDFEISPNFLINPNGQLTFNYQLYELAPYAAGFVDLTLPDGEGLIKTDFLPASPSFTFES